MTRQRGHDQKPRIIRLIFKVIGFAFEMQKIAERFAMDDFLGHGDGFTIDDRGIKAEFRFAITVRDMGEHIKRCGGRTALMGIG